MATLDILILTAYLLAVLGIGLWAGRGRRDLIGYVLAGKDMPWWALLGSIVATETSTATFLSVPGISFQSGGDLRFLQLALGFIIGRCLVAIWLLPSYFRGEILSAYELLEIRFGVAAKRTASLLFLVARNLGDGLRLFLAALALEAAFGVSLPLSVAVIGGVTIAYTLLGGMRSVVWNDCLQLVVYVAGGLAALTRAVEGAEDRPEVAVEDLQRIHLSRDDTVVGIATSGRTPYVIGGLRYAGQIGALTIGLTCNADSEMAAVSQQMIVPVVGPEVISGSTRLKAGTATKLVLNMLTTGAMVKLGKTYGNLMVDLQTTNQKLTHRSRRIVRELTGVGADDAAALLERCGGDVKTAIVVQRCGVSPPQAQRMLAAAAGQLRGALESAESCAGGSNIPAHDDRQVQPAELVLGVDGGGTKTVAWVARTDGGELQTVGRGEAGSSNPQAAGWPTALDNVQWAIDRALLAAGAGRTPVRAACLALAGTGRDADRQRVQAWAQRSGFSERVLVAHDALPVLAAGTPAGVGVALIAGTGSLAFGRNATGRTARAGGWGYLIGDEGSGYTIARQALQAAARGWDGCGPQTALGDRLLAELGLTQPGELVHAVYGRQQDRHWLAGLARVAIQAAGEGDPVAEQILSAAAADLAAMGCAVAKQLGFQPGPRPLHLAMAGGLLVNAAPLRERVIQILREGAFPQVEARMVPEPVAGAVRLAGELLAS